LTNFSDLLALWKEYVTLKNYRWTIGDFSPVLLKKLIGIFSPKSWNLDLQPSGPGPSEPDICLANKMEGDNRTIVQYYDSLAKDAMSINDDPNDEN